MAEELHQSVTMLEIEATQLAIARTSGVLFARTGGHLRGNHVEIVRAAYLTSRGRC